MKKIIALLFICAPIAIVFMACNDWSQSSSDLGKDYMSNLKEHIVIQKPTAVIACEKETLLKTRSQETVVYTITAKSDVEDVQLVTYLYITKSETGYLFEHYTEDDMLIAAVECDPNLMVLHIDVDYDEKTRGGLRSWWECTKYEYAKSKEDLEKKQDESMVWDVACEWLPCKTANAIMSGLYCMGLK